MPSDDSLGLAEEQALVPFRPEPSEGMPEQTIRLSEFGLARLPPEHRELMLKGQIFEQQQSPGLAARNR